MIIMLTTAEQIREWVWWAVIARPDSVTCGETHGQVREAVRQVP
jgi:hypothetical protein